MAAGSWGAAVPWVELRLVLEDVLESRLSPDIRLDQMLPEVAKHQHLEESVHIEKEARQTPQRLRLDRHTLSSSEQLDELNRRLVRTGKTGHLPTEAYQDVLV